MQRTYLLGISTRSFVVPEMRHNQEEIHQQSRENRFGQSLPRRTKLISKMRLLHAMPPHGSTAFVCTRACIDRARRHRAVEKLVEQRSWMNPKMQQDTSHFWKIKDAELTHALKLFGKDIEQQTT